MIKEKVVNKKVGEIISHDAVRNKYDIVIYEVGKFEKYAPNDELFQSIKRGRNRKVPADALIQEEWITFEKENILIKDVKLECEECKNKPLFNSEGDPYCPLCK
jgi:hypothetical protein